MTKGRVKLCLLCTLSSTDHNVTGVCLRGDGGLPWTAAAGGKACFLSRGTVESGESFPHNEMGGKGRRVCVWGDTEKTG